ncbi:hypothetical protein EV186_102101 [Labedaea rhizosphaerae]|uniref:Uncharacterized protein n=2 Tax=Labedaea rhizosphaerae TaxID=598644 RepID=A0A4R6SFF6_LABRH|nr:hypothetical protein EV186_102101 [Labedaea rhizosphaerae]
MDDAALLSFEHQLRMMDVVGLAAWSLDLDEPRFDLIGDERTLTTGDVQLLGTAAPGPQSWLWSWANPGTYRPDVLAVALRAREFGEKHGVAELAEPEVPFASLPGSPTEPAVVASYMMEAAKAATGWYTGYQGPVGDAGTRIGLLLRHPELSLPAPEGPRVSRVLQQGLTELRFGDQRRGVHAYGRRRDGLEVMHSGDVTRITGPDSLTIDLRFDDLNRFTAMSAHLGGSKTP